MFVHLFAKIALWRYFVTMQVQCNQYKKGAPVMDLYHYFDKSVGPFVSLSDIPIDEAKAVLEQIRQTKPETLPAGRPPEYIDRRHRNESKLKALFAQKGGIMKRHAPHYMVVEHSPWLSTWHENSGFIKIPIHAFDVRTISFTYGDMFPVFNTMYTHKMSDKEWHNTVYTYDEILHVIEKYGLPQAWNDDGRHGPSRYIEAHIWCDETIRAYR